MSTLMVRRKHFDLDATKNGTKFLVSRQLIETYNPEPEVEYTLLEYIQSTGTQWIDTLFKPSSVYKIVLDVMFTNSSGAHQNGMCESDEGQLIFSMQNGASLEHSFHVYSGDDSSYSNSETSGNSNTRVTFEYECTSSSSANVKINTYTTTAKKYSNANDLTFYIGARNHSSKVYSQEKIYSFKAYTNSTLVCNLIPVKDPDGTVCMYDKVSKAYFYNKGSGSFVAGPEVNS